MADIITPETLDNLRALLVRRTPPHPDAPINTAFADMADPLVEGEPLWAATSAGAEVVDLADRIARIAGKALWFDDSADYSTALWEILAVVHPRLADLIESDNDDAQGVLYPPPTSTTPAAPE